MIVSLRHVLIAFLLFCVKVAVAGLPFFPQSVELLNQDQIPKAGYTRLRIQISNNDFGIDKQVQMGAFSVCSKSACYRPLTKTAIDLYDTSQGKSEEIANIAVPYMEVHTVHFESVAGGKIIAGDITLGEPFKLEEGYEGGEILVVASKVASKQGVVYSPTMVATGLLRSSGESVYYNPRIPVSASLKFGTTLSIPAKATLSPQILNIAIHDTGNTFPLIDIYPLIKFAQPVLITSSEIPRTANIDLTSRNPSSAQVKKVSTYLLETGVIKEGGGKKSSLESDFQAGAVANAATDQCTAALSLAQNQQTLTSALVATGTAYLNWCGEYIAVYSHCSDKSFGQSGVSEACL